MTGFSVVRQVTGSEHAGYREYRVGQGGGRGGGGHQSVQPFVSMELLVIMYK